MIRKNWNVEMFDSIGKTKRFKRVVLPHTECPHLIDKDRCWATGGINRGYLDTDKCQYRRCPCKEKVGGK